MIFKKHLIHLSVFVFLFCMGSVAEARDDFPTCYTLIDMPANTEVDRELFVLIDQTIAMDESLQKSVYAKVHSFLQRGDKVTLLVFSAYVQTNYTNITLSGQLDKLLSGDERFNTSKTKLRKFDACMGKQLHFIDAKLKKSIESAFKEARDDIPKTELAGSILEIGRSVIQPSKAKEKIILLVSDMLENSDVVSVYKNHRVVKINAKKAFEKTKRAGNIADLSDSKVFIIGAGVMPKAYQKSYRSAAVMRSIENYWRKYFKEANATLAGWGQPVLLMDIY